MSKSKLLCGASVAAGALMTVAVLSHAGDLNPPPGPPAPTMRTLTEVYDAVRDLRTPGGCGPALPGELRADGRMTIVGNPFPGAGATFDILGFSETALRPAAGAFNPGLVTIRKNFDAASPRIMQAIATGVLLQSATLVLRDAVGDYYSVQMNNVFVREVKPEVQAVCGGGSVHTESVSFAFSQITWTDLRSGTTYTYSP